MQASSPTLYGPVTIDAANGIVLSGAASGAVPSIRAVGADNDINLDLLPKNGGVVYSNAFYADRIHLALAVTGLIAADSTGINATAIGATTPAAGRFTTLFSASVDLEGGAIDNTPIGTTTAAAGRFTTLALTGSQTAKFVLAAPNTAAGVPAWRQLLSSDISGLGTFATANAAAPPAIGDTTANAGRFTTLTATGFLQRSAATGLTAGTTNTQAGALALTAGVNNITTAAANSAVRLPATAPATGTAAEIIVRNGGANAVNVFPASGAAINALAANAAFSLAAGTSARFLQLTAALYITA